MSTRPWALGQSGSQRYVGWLRAAPAAAESGQSEATGWPEVPPPVDTRELLTLTPACFRAQIDGIGADPRSTSDYHARGRRSRRLLRAESCLADALRDARGQGGWLFQHHLQVQQSASLQTSPFRDCQTSC